jgi:5-methylcytosine-specific restriction endonuclease McrA
METEPKPEIAAADIDYYNVRENRIAVYERDAYKCRYCEKQLTRFTATLDHVTPVAEGGDNSFGNLVTACLDCNSRKNKRPVGDFLVEQ